jgi:hypothetical protein
MSATSQARIDVLHLHAEASSGGGSKPASSAIGMKVGMYCVSVHRLNQGTSGCPAACNID